ncbi:putative Permease [Candidatus Sulfopaludibacter sp. SbA6]|nr:putative Permease [Candidatus Sulfopaludibacter sp. SbA6]
MSVQTVVARGWRRLVFRWRRERLYRELAEEIESHRRLKEAENGRAGLTPQAVRDLSRWQMGNIAMAQEECRNMWSFVKLDRLFEDLRYALRLFRRTPAFTAIAVLSLAIGIGGNTAMFSLVDKLLVQPLPYPEPDRLIRVTGIYPRAAVPIFQQQSRTMEVAAVSAGSDYNLTGQGEAARIFGSAVSANLFPVLGAPVARGRSFEAGEDLPGRDSVAILSDSLWRNQFGADPGIVGRAIRLNGIQREIVGIMPPGFSYPSSRVEAWVPLRLDPSKFVEYWGDEFVPLVGRMRRGATIPQAQSEVRAMVARFRGMFPYPMARDWNADATAISLQQELAGDIRGKLIILLACVGMVLLIACANVASLLLSRAMTRRKEIALRVALGAGRFRIVRQLLTESVLLALAGGGLGILLGTSALSIFKSVLPATTPGLSEAAIDWQVAGAAAALSLFTGLAFGLAPALSASRVDLAKSIKTGSQRSTATAWTRLRSWLIGAEVALTLVLVVSAGLLMRSLYGLSEAHSGFQARQILTVRISPNQSSCTERAACIALYQRLIERARGIAGVTDAAVANSVPLDGYRPTIPVDVEGHPKTVDHPSPVLWLSASSPGYIDMLSIPLLAGRGFTEADGAMSAGVLLITASTARYFWPAENPIGKHIRIAGEERWRTVVGVVGDVRQYSLSQDLPNWVPGGVYMPYAQSARENGQIIAAMTLLVKTRLVNTRADATRLAREIRGLAKDQDPNAPVGQVQEMEEVVSGSISDFRSTIRVFISFAGAAILLAAIGIYGLISHWVTQRTFEIGVRVAMGATRPHIVSMILAQGLRVALYGTGAGVVAALAVTRFLGSLLYGVGATDPLTFAAVAALVLGVAITATAFPACRAARIDPLTSLRVD